MGPEFTTGESVTLTCSAPRWEKKMQFCFLKAREQMACTRQALEDSQSYQIGRLGMEDSGSYTCMYRVAEPGQEISSLESQPISIRVTDSLPQPLLIVDPSSGVVNEGLPLLITCVAPGDLGTWSFHFYKDGTEIVPRDKASDISTMKSVAGSMNISVLSIPQAGPNNTGEFTCGYEKNLSGRWIQSSRSQAVTVTWNVTRNYNWRGWALPLPLVAGCGGGGAILGLLALLGCCCCRRKKKATGSSKTATG
ncbi:hypothetical protein KIL84_009751 [Mauremys mutica]|uniref:Ig-like domain-containing protein n=1 Tax=Mauremys mutica TaxID=74926 RepID=A0A9D3XLS5_9SAUR|nr:hypothetical protein KIL84_009751 [Mauremys mutica]